MGTELLSSPTFGFRPTSMQSLWRNDLLPGNTIPMNIKVLFSLQGFCPSSATRSLPDPCCWWTMSPLSNSSGSSHPVFMLLGFPGLETHHYWISIPFCSVYLIALLGNSTILFVIKTNPSLHEPMYGFLCMLAITDLGLSLSTLPTVLDLFWFNIREIGFSACAMQLFFIHTFSFMESLVLLAMAFNCYVAICIPLKYTRILTNLVLVKIGLAIAARSSGIVFPTPWLLRRYTYCKSNLLSHSFCLHQDVLKLSCSDSSVNSMYGLCVILSTLVIDALLILLSYLKIIRTVTAVASREEQLKAFNTCVSHICVVLIFFITVIGVSMMHTFGKQVSPIAHILMADVYLLIPPVLNPIVYSVKTQPIQKGILKTLGKRRTICLS
ncbi:olfactory receptor 51L1-like [Hemicordylus capensis]|uniref:olfactory receptor 51L1-like n=1 Tax=Hemicordylus capensis TaxID=884348 RepID=UPI0023036FE0|nr:olfactory receptor 51L1-like [Hemicordylus capensis]